MRILILANAGIGLYKFRRELVESLCRENEVVAVLPEDEYSEPLQKLGCRVIGFDFERRGTNPFKDLSQLRRYRAVLKELKPEAVLTYTVKPNVWGGLACRRERIPYIANVTGLGTAVENGGPLAFLTLSLYRMGLRGASCVFFQNSGNLALFEEKRVVSARARLLPGSGVNLTDFAPQPYPETAGTSFLFVGRLMRDKGINEFISAARALHQEDPSVTADIVGWCEGEEPAELSAAVSEGAVRFHGAQSEVRPFYRACSCAVLPSYHEGMANVMLEASATARPVITTRVPGCMETFTESVTGFGCEPKDTASLLNAMRAFAALPIAERKRMGLEARKKMEKEFDRSAVVSADKEELTRLHNDKTNEKSS